MPPLRKSTAAFSMVEVVLALGLITLVGFAIIGLLSVGLQGTRDSKEQLQSATLAEAICTTLRAAPTSNYVDTHFPQSGFPVPYITNSVNNFAATPVYLTWDGMATNKASARFGLYYGVTVPAGYVTSVSPSTASVYLCFFWPAASTAIPASSGGHFEVASSFALP